MRPSLGYSLCAKRLVTSVPSRLRVTLTQQIVLTSIFYPCRLGSHMVKSSSRSLHPRRVTIVSIVWIFVVLDATQPDISCEYLSFFPHFRWPYSVVLEKCWYQVTCRGSINFGIWSTLELSIAVICPCIPSLRPLIIVVRNGVFQHPLVRRTLKSNITIVMSSKPK